MTDLKTKLSEVLDSIANASSSVGVAVVAGAEAPVEVVWLPQDSDNEPVFLAYSLTKTLIATLLLLLWEEARLSLEDRLARWFPRIAGADQITLRQLLNHTAGIPDYGGLASYHKELSTSPGQPWSFERFAAETFEKGLCFEPGTNWAYSNPGYMLLKQIAEEVSGTSYASLLHDRIIQPLQLSSTFVPDSLEALAPLAPAFSQALSIDGTPRDVRHHYHPGWVSHGVVASTPSDLVRFLDALFCRLFLSPQALHEMTTLVSVPIPSVRPTQENPRRWVQPSYGLGLMADPASPWGPIWGHNGGGPGYSTSAFHAPGLDRISVCAMAATEANFSAEDIVFATLIAVTR